MSNKLRLWFHAPCTNTRDTKPNISIDLRTARKASKEAGLWAWKAGVAREVECSVAEADPAELRDAECHVS